MKSINKKHTQHNAVNKTLTHPFRWGGVVMVLCVLVGVCSPVWAKSPSVVPDLDGQIITLLDGSTATLVKTEKGYAVKHTGSKKGVFSGFVKDAQGALYKVDVSGENKINVSPFKHDLDFTKTMIENCDIDGNHKIYGRKDAVKNNINMVIARKEFRCKMGYESEVAKAGLAEAEAGLAEAEARGRELDAELAEAKAGLAEAEARGKELDERLKKAFRSLGDTVTKE